MYKVFASMSQFYDSPERRNSTDLKVLKKAEIVFSSAGFLIRGKNMVLQ
jgi:hypothetical protein